jgi:hypothetical protein
MNTTKSVYNKLFSEDKLELASERVELANINDLVNELKKAEKLFTEFNNLYAQVDNLQPKIVKIGNELFASQQKLNSMESIFSKQFAELGLKFSDYPEYKNVSSFMSKSNVIKSMTDKIAQL